MAITSLRNKGYQKKKNKLELEGKKGKQLYDVVDEIVAYLVDERSNLIVQIEKNELDVNEIDRYITDYINKHDIVIEDINTMDEIIKSVKSFIWGYGSINEYIDMLDVTDISIKGENDSWIKERGVRKEIKLPFMTERSVENFCHSISLKTRGNLSQRNAFLVTGDSFTSDKFNLRLNIGIKPVATKPFVIIRKIPKWTIKPDMDKLEGKNMFNREVREYLEDISTVGLNYCVVGQGASGKSTLVNALIELIPEAESKLAIQEVPELSSGKKNWTWLEVVKSTGESDVQYKLEDEAQFGLTMDLDWYIIGESKGGESMAIFDASFTGHKIAFTVHAPNTQLAIDKIVFNMKKSGTDYTDEKLEYLLSTLDTIIFMNKYKVCEITEIEGWDRENNKLKLRPVFEFKITHDDGVDLFGDWIRINESCERVKNKKRVKKIEGEVHDGK